PVRTSVGGLPAVTAGFAAATDNGTLRGTVLFVEYGGAVYRLVGYATDARWPAVQVTVERALQSFARLTDPATLAVQPQRVDIVRIDRRTTIEEMARQRPSPVPAATLALVNQVEPQTPLEPGRLVKWIVGQPLPSGSLLDGQAARPPRRTECGHSPRRRPGPRQEKRHPRAAQPSTIDRHELQACRPCIGRYTSHH